MRLQDTHRCRALLVVVLLGFTALTLHTSMHTPSQPQSCELCGGHVNPSHAFTPAAQLPLLVPSTEFTAQFIQQAVKAETLTWFLQRAPPLQS